MASENNEDIENDAEGVPPYNISESTLKQVLQQTWEHILSEGSNASNYEGNARGETTVPDSEEEEEEDILQFLEDIQQENLKELNEAEKTKNEDYQRYINAKAREFASRMLLDYEKEYPEGWALVNIPRYVGEKHFETTPFMTLLNDATNENIKWRDETFEELKRYDRQTINDVKYYESYSYIWWLDFKKIGWRKTWMLLRKFIRKTITVLIRKKIFKKLLRECFRKIIVGNPVLVSSGKAVDDDPSFLYEGSFSIEIGSVYNGGLNNFSPLGYNRMSLIDAIIFKTPDNRLCLVDENCFPVHFNQPRPDPGAWEGGDTTRALRISRGVSRKLIVVDGALKQEFKKYKDNIWRLICIENRQGQKITIIRNQLGHAVRIEHPDGISFLFDNNQNGLREAVYIKSRAGKVQNIINYKYNEYFMLSHVDAIYGDKVYYEYDKNKQLIKTKKSNGYCSIRHYDEDSRVIQTQTNGPHNNNKFEYDTKNHTMTFYENGIEENYEKFYLDKQDGAVIAQENALGNKIYWEFDNVGYPSALINAKNEKIEFSYDSRGKIKSIKDAEGRETFYYWGSNTTLDFIIDPLGNSWNYEYDTNGAITAFTDPEGIRTDIINNDIGLPIKTMRADGLMEIREYDKFNQLIGIQDFQGSITKFSYDDYGRPTSVTDPSNATTFFEYDDITSLDFWTPSKVIYPDASITQNLQKKGQIEQKIIDREGRITFYRYGYGPNNLLTEYEDANGGKVQIFYDGQERLEAIQNQLGKLWRFEYDVAGRLIKEIDFDNFEIKYSYDEVDRLIETTFPDDAKILYYYDKSGLIVEERSFNANEADPFEVINFQYDKRGFLSRVENNAAVVTFERDKIGRITADIVNGRRMENIYDCCGNRIERLIGDNNLKLEYDPMGEVVKAIINNHGDLSFKRNKIRQELIRESSSGFFLEQNYDVLGQVLRQTAGIMIPKGIDGLRQAQQQKLPIKPLMSRLYTWGKGMTPLKIKDRNWGELSYKYDNNGQVLKTVFGDNSSEQFKYDLTLNLSGSSQNIVSEYNKKSFNNDVNYKLEKTHETQIEGSVFQWDTSEGGRVNKAKGPNGEIAYLEYDKRNRVIKRIIERKDFSKKIWLYEWDVKDRLISCVTPEKEHFTYQYDPFGRRIFKINASEARKAALVIGKETSFNELKGAYYEESGNNYLTREEAIRFKVGTAYFWDNNVIAEEAPLLMNGHVQWDQAIKWYYEADGYHPMAKETSEGELFYIINDHLGTPKEMFTEDGRLVWCVEHTTWGNIRQLWRRSDNNNYSVSPFYLDENYIKKVDDHGDRGSEGIFFTSYSDNIKKYMYECPIRFQGQWADEETGLYYNRFRYYDPLIGQYISRDPLGIDGGLQSYAYVNIPTGWVDPLGLYGVYIFKVDNKGKCYVGKGDELRFVTSMIGRAVIARTGSSKGNRKAAKNACPRGWHSNTDRIANQLGVDPKDFGAMVENRLIDLYGTRKVAPDWLNARIDGAILYGKANDTTKAAATRIAEAIKAKFGKCN